MGAAAAASSVLSVASLGLGMQSTMMQGQATKSADEFKAAQAERAAEFGRLQASLTDTSMRENLNTTLGNIEAIRAAAHADPTSPTTAAYVERQEMLSDRARTAQVMSQNAQAAEEEASAKYLRQAGEFAMEQSQVKAGAQMLGGIAGLLKSTGGGG